MSTTRTPSRALLIPACLLLVHRLVHGSGRKRVLVYPDVDQRRLARLPGTLESGTDVLGLADLLPVAAEHLGEQVVLHIAELVADVPALFAVLLDLAVADLVHVRVVAHHADEREVEADHRLEVPAREAEAAVAEQADHLAVGPGELRGHREGNAHAERAERTGIHPQSRSTGLDDPAREGDDIAAVADVDRVVGEELVDLVREPQRMDRRVLPHQLREALLLRLLLLVAQRLEPGLAVARGALGALALRGVGHGGQDGARVADEPEGGVAGLAHRAVVHVDLDHRGVLAQAFAVAHPEVERRPDDQDHVGILEREAARLVEVVRIARRQGAAGRAVHERGDVESADEVLRGLRAARSPHLAAEQHARPVGLDEYVRQAIDVVRIAGALGRGAVVARLRDDRALERHLGVEDVAPDLQIRGARRTRVCLAEGHGAHVRDALGGEDARRELRDRLHQVHVREVLQGAHAVLVERPLAADQEHRALGTQRVGDAGDRVGRARAGGDDRAAGPSRDARISVRCVRSNLLVANVDDLDALVDAAVVDVDDVPAAEGEDHVDPLGAKCLGHKVATRDRLGLADGCGLCLYRGARGGHLVLLFLRGPAPGLLSPGRGVSVQRAGVRSTSSARSSACLRTRRSASSASRASSASMMCMWSTMERSARSSSPIMWPRIARTCTSRPATSALITGERASSMMRWWKLRFASEYSS